MDIKCPKCAEPWDMYSLHDVCEQRYEEKHGIVQKEDWARDRDGTNKRYEPIYEAVAAEFRVKGCEVFDCSHNGNTAHPGIAEIYELLGDDMDGAASLLDDADYLGMLDG